MIFETAASFVASPSPEDYYELPISSASMELSSIRTLSRGDDEADLEMLNTLNALIGSDDSDIDLSSDEDDVDGISKITIKEREKLLIEADEQDADLMTNIVTRTKNEAVELPPVEKVDVEIPLTYVLVKLGHVCGIVGELLLIQTSNVDDVKILDIDTIVLLENRTVIGRIFEVIGQVAKPIYTVRFNSRQEIDDADLKIESPVFVVPELAKFLFTSDIRAFKGSDASNVYDEEVGDDEREFSDDEAEVEAKRLKKQSKKKNTTPNDSDSKSIYQIPPNQPSGRGGRYAPPTKESSSSNSSERQTTFNPPQRQPPQGGRYAAQSKIQQQQNEDIEYEPISRPAHLNEAPPSSAVSYAPPQVRQNNRNIRNGDSNNRNNKHQKPSINQQRAPYSRPNDYSAAPFSLPNPSQQHQQVPALPQQQQFPNMGMISPELAQQQHFAMALQQFSMQYQQQFMTGAPLPQFPGQNMPQQYSPIMGSQHQQKIQQFSSPPLIGSHHHQQQQFAQHPQMMGSHQLQQGHQQGHQPQQGHQLQQGHQMIPSPAHYNPQFSNAMKLMQRQSSQSQVLDAKLKQMLASRQI